VSISFGVSLQEFNIGAASVGTYGMPAGVCEAARRFGRVPLEQLTTTAASLAREGVPLNPMQAYIVELLAPIVTSTPEAAALFAPEGRLLGAGDRLRQPELADALHRLATEGASPFYEGDIAAATVEWLSDRGGIVTRKDLAAYEVLDREPLHVGYRDREVLTNPPPSAGGILIARALALLDALPSPPSVVDVVGVMERTQRPSSSPASTTRPSSRRFSPAVGGWGRPPISPRSTATGGRARSPAQTVRPPGSSSPERVSTSTTCSASTISTRSAFTATGRGAGCRA
jgi:gamma-glutamyltranspeptidase/glutathione hydrolase